jgi:hypothetical protein
MDMSTKFGLAKSVRAALAAERKLVAQLPTLMPNLVVLVDGSPVTGAQVVAKVQRHITAEEQILDLKAQLRELQSRVKPVRVGTRKALLKVQTAAAVAFGDYSPSFASLGFETKQLRKIPAVVTKVEAIGKARETRVARGTKGTRQKASIHGDAE